MRRIDSLYAAGRYTQTLNAIRELRAHHPRAVASRRKALKLWQEASLKEAQTDIAHTDSALQAAEQAYRSATDFGTKNWLRVRRDSLRTRYETLVGTVHLIHRRQKGK